MHTLRPVRSPTVYVLQVSIPWNYPGSYCSVGGAVVPIVPELARAGSVTGDGVRDRDVRELCLEVLSREVTIGSGLLWLLSCLTSPWPGICVLRPWSAEG